MPVIPLATRRYFEDKYHPINVAQRRGVTPWLFPAHAGESLSTPTASESSDSHVPSYDSTIDPQLRRGQSPANVGAQPHTSMSPLPSGRKLPSRDVTDATIDDAYAEFIMHCNPAIPLGTDTSELRKGFRAAPKSDGKSFSTFRLFELIKKFEKKELKTWAQVAIELGVELPALDKGQSAQKVQQYAVRLKVRNLCSPRRVEMPIVCSL